MVGQSSHSGASKPLPASGRVTEIDEILSRMRTLRNSIWRDRKLLRMQLTESERMIIDKRLLETHSAFDNLLASMFPVVL
jgi:hypothetical protein